MIYETPKDCFRHTYKNIYFLQYQTEDENMMESKNITLKDTSTGDLQARHLRVHDDVYLTFPIQGYCPFY